MPRIDKWKVMVGPPITGFLILLLIDASGFADFSWGIIFLPISVPVIFVGFFSVLGFLSLLLVKALDLLSKLMND